MTNTVIGFFRNSIDAYHAADILKERGFDSQNIDISSNTENSEYGNREERSGKIGNFFKSLFTDDDDNARRYSNFAENNSVVTVHTLDISEAERASEILDECGAIDIDEGYAGMESHYSEGGLNPGMNFEDSKSPESFNDENQSGSINQPSEAGYGRNYENSHGISDREHESRSIPIIEEEVNVGKKEVRRGGVRVHSRIIERPVEETLRLREERVHVERNPVSREASEADLENFHEETIEMNEYGEEAMVSKKARVVEEVRVGKEVHEREETIHETERKTEVDIENVEDEEKFERSSHRKR